MNNNDRRVRKTKDALKNAFAQLMLKKEIQQITINELTSLADIHRATFYTHYKDIYDLYDKLEKDVIRDLNQIFSINPQNNYDGIYRLFIDYAKKHLPIIKMLLSTNSNQRFRESITTLLVQNYLNIWRYEDKVTEVTKEMSYLTSYISKVVWLSSVYGYKMIAHIQLKK